MSDLKVAGFAGSLRKNSLNRLLLRSAIDLAPPGMTIEELDIQDIPLFNADLEEDSTPESVLLLKRAIETADGLLVISPEYNWGIPAVTKNIIDWCSRRVSEPANVLMNKPVSIMSIAAGRGTGALVRAQIRQVLVYPKAITMPSGDVGISGGISNFDENGKLSDETTITQVKNNLSDFADWILKTSA